MARIISIFIILQFLLTLNIHAQGCNDAGLCTLGELDGQGLSGNSKYNTQVSYTFGLGEQQVLHNSIQLEQRFRLVESKLQAFVQLPFHFNYGNLGYTYGLGDVSLGMNYHFARNKELLASAMVAAKLPSDDASKTYDGKGMPMAYQTSLGTYDLALGVNVFYGKWQFGAGYLKAFGTNNNYFYYDEWPDNEDALEYVEMSELRRGDDAMLRINRFFTTKKNRYNVSLLTLYRIRKDQVLQDGQSIALDHSDGLTLNLVLGYQKMLKNKDAITLSVAAPLITREVRVDGLTRTAVIMFTYAFGKKEGVFTEIEF